MRLEAKKLAFGYPERPVGHDVDVSLGPGEVRCLLGPNGSGKTTLFKTLLGLLAPQGGEVRLGDQGLADLTRPQIARRIAYVPQAGYVPFPFTALDIVMMGRIAHRGLLAGPSPEDRKASREALEELGIGELAGRDVTRLSGGQRQLVLVARALAQGSPLIVMDEPTASLDFGNQAIVLTAIRQLAARGVGIVLATHDPEHAFAVGTGVTLLKDGRVLASGPPIEVLTAERLMAVYGVPVVVEQLASGQIVCTHAFEKRGAAPAIDIAGPRH